MKQNYIINNYLSKEEHYPMKKEDLILVTGATGYVGGRLVPILKKRGYRVRCLVRDSSKLESRGWTNIEIACGDVLDYSTLLPAMKNVAAAYYLIHSMTDGKGFQERELTLARNFARAARESGIRRIIYLGGLGKKNELLSPHLKSRQQTGDTLRESGLPVTEFRAAQIIGSGSASFELIRNLAERIPVLLASNLIETLSQPIAIRDVLRYLTDSLEIPESDSAVIEIGGSQVLSYREMILKYAEIRNIKRRIIKLSFVPSSLYAFMANLVTPIPYHIARPLLEGLKNEVIVHDNTAEKLFSFNPIGYEDAVRLALRRIDMGEVLTTWQDACYSFYGTEEPVKLTSAEGMIIEKRKIQARSDPQTAYMVILAFGGQEGWFYADYLWRLRGLLDWLFGGVGLKRNRRCPTKLRIGDTLGFWRVEDLRPDRLLRLRSEMKMRSRGWLQFEIEPIDTCTVMITQTAFFEPKGLPGIMYWYVLYPVHKLIFKGMLRTLASHAEQAMKSKNEN